MYKFKLLVGRHRANFKSYVPGDFYFSEKRIDKVNSHWEYLGVVEEPKKEVEKIEPKVIPKKTVAKKSPVKNTRKRITNTKKK